MPQPQQSPIDTRLPHPILEEIERRVALPQGVSSAQAFSAVMNTLSRRLTLGEARHLVQALARDVRPLIEGSLKDRREEPEHFGRDELLARVQSELGTDQPEPIVRGVFLAAERHLSSRVFKHVRSQLPLDLRQMWTAPA